MRKKLLPVLLTFALAIALLTVGALADASDNVIYVNANDTTADTETGVGTASNPYNSLDAAVDKAPDGSVIEILSDVTTDGLELRKDLTIRGGMVAEGTEKYTIKFVEYGIALWGKSLTFENCNVEMSLNSRENLLIRILRVSTRSMHIRQILISFKSLTSTRKYKQLVP